jgi:hypothetical protein
VQDANVPGGDAETYEPPAFGSPSSQCHLDSYDPFGFDLNKSQHHYFYTDANQNVGIEIKYSSGRTCGLIGTVAGYGLPDGIAVDAPEAVK